LLGAATGASILRALARTFTPDEANAALIDVRPLAEQMVEAKRALDAAQEESDVAARSISGNGGGIPPAELAALHQQLEHRATVLAGIVSELHELGVQVKDLDSGLVDFPSLRGGEPVLLCWRVGEDEVAFWHGLEDGFAGRQPL
jgi:hypothetical protein